MTKSDRLCDWTPVQNAGDEGGPIELMARHNIIMRLQDGLLIARARLLVRQTRAKSSSGETHAPCSETTITRETDALLPPSFWASDRLGFFDHAFWSDGDQRLTDFSTTDESYDGDHTTFYGIQLRTPIDTSGYRAGYVDVVKWCQDWLARQRSSGLRTGENIAWPEFKNEPCHVGLSRDDVFRPAFRAAKQGEP